MTGASYLICAVCSILRSLNVGSNDRIASSAYNQKELKSVGSGKWSLANGDICASSAFLSLDGKCCAKVVSVHDADGITGATIGCLTDLRSSTVSLLCYSTTSIAFCIAFSSN